MKKILVLISFFWIIVSCNKNEDAVQVIVDNQVKLLKSSVNTILTPNRSKVTVSFVPEFATGAELDEITNYYASAYGSCAELVDPASNTYNCHGYAWIMSNGLTIEEVCRISQHNLAPYWNDFSYLETTLDSAEIVLYTDADHSARIVSRNPLKLISKFNVDGPVMIHNLENCGYETSNLKFYRQNPFLINGKILITNYFSQQDRTYTVNERMITNENSNVGKQVTSNITWSIEALKNTPYSETLSISNTGVVSPGRYEGEARIKATFESYLGSTTTTLVIYCGTSGSDYLPNLIEINGSGQKFCSSKVTNKIRFLFNNPSMISTFQFKFILKKSDGTVVYKSHYFDGEEEQVLLYHPGYHTFDEYKCEIINTDLNISKEFSVYFKTGCTPSHTFDIVGSSNICGNETYSLNSSSLNVKWSASPGLVCYKNDNGSCTVYNNNAANGLGWVQVVINESIVVRKNLIVGVYIPTQYINLLHGPYEGWCFNNSLGNKFKFNFGQDEYSLHENAMANYAHQFRLKRASDNSVVYTSRLYTTLQPEYYVSYRPNNDTDLYWIEFRHVACGNDTWTRLGGSGLIPFLDCGTGGNSISGL